jgi:type IV pilus assembly protein PilW
MHDESRFAIRELTRDLNMAGFMGDILAPGAITLDASLAIGVDCDTAGGTDWAYGLTVAGTGEDTSLMALDNITTAAAVSEFSCLAAGELVAGTDIVSIKRLAAGTTDDVDVGSAAIRTNGTIGALYVEPIAGAVPAPFDDWMYTPSVYFIRAYTNVVGDDIPSLCRKVLVAGVAAPSMATECIAQGVENLQVEYGVDSSGDGSVNAYVTDPSQAELESTVSVRVFLLARVSADDGSFDNNKTYVLSNADEFTPDDNVRRRVYTTTVAVPNLRNRQLIGI